MTGDYRTTLYFLLATVAGAITSLSFKSWENLSRTQIAMALFVSGTFGYFVGPFVTHLMFGSGPIDLKLQGFAIYATGAASTALIPIIIKRMGAVLGFEKDAKP